MGIIAANTLPYPACSTQSKLLLADLEHRQAMMCKFNRWHLKAQSVCVWYLIHFNKNFTCRSRLVQMLLDHFNRPKI